MENNKQKQQSEYDRRREEFGYKDETYLDRMRRENNNHPMSRYSNNSAHPHAAQIAMAGEWARKK